MSEFIKTMLIGLMVIGSNLVVVLGVIAMWVSTWPWWWVSAISSVAVFYMAYDLGKWLTKD